MGHVSRRAAHVEADDAPDPGDGGRPGGADDPPRRPGEDRVLALEQGGVGEPAVRLHEHEPRLPRLARHLLHVAAQDRGQVGVDHRRVAAPDDLHERARLMAERHLGEADPPCDRAHLRLVLGVAVGVHEDDGDGAVAVVVGGLELGLGLRLVERALPRPVGPEPLVHLDDRDVTFYWVDYSGPGQRSRTRARSIDVRTDPADDPTTVTPNITEERLYILPPERAGYGY